MNDNFWQRKLCAFLHDPPCKALDILHHEEIAKGFLEREGLLDFYNDSKQFHKDADHVAASCDRFPFPQKKAASHFDGTPNATFVHPFPTEGAEPAWHELSGLVDKETALTKAEEALQDACGSIEGTVQQKFFLFWRRWQEEASAKFPALDFFPADTRIPDHSIWRHLEITSALEGCRNPENNQIEPAFLLFQAGPVQDFISAARSTRDLWSGSYMLSWLMGHAIKAITDEVGPDSIIFPYLRGNGIFDALHKDFYTGISYPGKDGKKDNLWKRLYPKDTEDTEKKSAKILLTPTLTNRFFAVLPKAHAADLARKAEKAFRDELWNISEDCWRAFSQLAKGANENPEIWKQRWDKQVELLSSLTWEVLPVTKDIAEIQKLVEKLPGQNEEHSPLQNLKALLQAAQKNMPLEDRDARFFDASRNKLTNWGITWGIQYALCDYALAARRNTRDFARFETDPNQNGTPKDALTGKEEIIGSEALWDRLKKNNDVFKDNEGPYGAITIIKRLWCRGDNCYLKSKLGNFAKGEYLGFDSVPDVAEKNQDKNSPYVAILAMDGDHIGQWMSGGNAPRLAQVLAGKAREYFKALHLDNLPRTLTPSYHLQFTEMLSNFANHIAEDIVSEHDGQLIYAGGDDVLAMLPADQVFDCANKLRENFRGTNGFVTKDGKTYLVPGPRADLSCGIAIAHKNFPLQSMVQEARLAESRAKQKYNRAAFSVSLLKRGGEIIQWGAKWESQALALYKTYCDRRADDANGVSARFPYALARLLAPYELEKGSFISGLDIRKLITKELEHVLEQQIENKEARKKLREACEAYLNFLENHQTNAKPDDFASAAGWADFPKLFLVAAFITRERGENA